MHSNVLSSMNPARNRPCMLTTSDVPITMPNYNSGERDNRQDDECIC